MEPTLDTLDASLPGVKALHAFSNHIQELSELETTLSEPYEVQEKNISTFCEGIMDKIKGMTQEDVTLTVNAPQIECKNQPLSNWNASCCICWKTPPSTPLPEEKYGWTSRNAVRTPTSSSSATPVAVSPRSNAKTSSSLSPK